METEYIYICRNGLVLFLFVLPIKENYNKCRSQILAFITRQNQVGSNNWVMWIGYRPIGKKKKGVPNQKKKIWLVSLILFAYKMDYQLDSREHIIMITML